VGRAHDLLRTRQLEKRRFATDQLRQAKIGNLYSALAIEEDILGLDVTMNDSFFVGVLERVTDLLHDGQRFLRRHPTFLKELPQVHAIDILHDEAVLAVGFAKVMHADNIGMIEPGQRLCFAREPLGEIGIAS
jgi:hypothetical protein